MAGRTLSAYVDDSVVARVADIGKLEGRKSAQIAGTAVRFYTDLAPDARTALRALEAFGTVEEQDWALREVTRVLLRAQLAMGQRLAAQDATLPAGDSEEDILAAAVAATARPFRDLAG